jgi:HK97 family phage major capsid protein
MDIKSTRAAKRAELDTALEAADTVRADELISEIKALDVRAEELAALEAREAKAAKAEAVVAPASERAAVVTREERTYTAEKAERGEVSFFSDAYNASTRGDSAARDRLERSAREAAVEGETSKRAVATGGFAGLVVPQYLTDMAALALRNGRPLANLLTRFQLPEQGTSLIIPRGTTGAATAIQATENSTVQQTDEVWANVTVPVATIAGSQQVSRQSLERGIPGLDALIYLDIAGAYAANLDTQVIYGTGTSGQMTGICPAAGFTGGTASAFLAAPTASTFYSKVAGQIATMAAAGTAISPKLIVMHPRRWGWLTLQVDTAGRPLVVPTVDGAFNAVGINGAPGAYSGDGPNPYMGARIVGYLHGLPVITDANVPSSVGTPAEDFVMIIDTSNVFLWENGDGLPKFLNFEQTAGTALTTTIVGYNYAAVTALRYPAAVGRVGAADTVANQGLVAPTY